MKNYYKTNNQAVLDAIETHQKQRGDLRDQASAFAKRFGAKDYLILRSVDKCYFGGLKFEPEKDRRFWTVPDRDHGRQRPRKSVAGMTPEEKAAHNTLFSDWVESYPKTKVSFEPIYQALGTTWGDLIFGAGMAWFLHDGFLYVATGAKVADHMIEIFGSEYTKAEVEFDAQKKVAA
jgi:hypothetical protein